MEKEKSAVVLGIRQILSYICGMNKQDMTKSVAKAVKQARLNKTMTESDVAKYLDVSLRTYQRIESGQMTLDNLCLVCELFGLDLFNLNPSVPVLEIKPQYKDKTVAEIMQEKRAADLAALRAKRK